MYEMFTDQDPMRLDDFKLPADYRSSIHIAKRETVCYNKNKVEDELPPKSEKRTQK